MDLSLNDKNKLEKPKVAKRFPFSMQLDQNKEYLWCSCGLSKTQPFCDGKHIGTKFKPIQFKPKSKYVLLCGCKRIEEGTGPYCDGSHSTKDLDW